MIEVKSGYGLERDAELAMLCAARELERRRPIRVKTSFLGAHAVAPEYRGRPDAYLEEICLPTLREAHARGLVGAVDGFCEGIGFSPAQIERVFKGADVLGLPVRLHAEQLSNLGSARLAARFGALSAEPPGTCHRRGCRRHGASRHRCGAAARRLLHPARNEAAAGRRLACPRRADGRGNGLQPGLFAPDISAATDLVRSGAIARAAGLELAP